MISKSIYILAILWIPFTGCSQDLSKDEDAKKYFCEKKEYACENLDDICLDRPASFKKVIVLGTFANDRGCMCESFLVDGKIGDWKKMVGAALRSNDWSNTSQSDETLLKMLKEMSMAFGDVYMKDEKINHKDAKPITAPKITHTKTDCAVVYWIENPVGMTPINSYTKLSARFSKKGELESIDKVDGFSVPVK